MAKTKPHPLDTLAGDSIRLVSAYLYDGGLFGGKSLATLIAEYKAQGPFTPVRGELVAHLHRCIDALVTMDTAIVARARTIPDLA